MRCPRCHDECDSGATACAACGAPIAFADEPPPAALDRDLDLDPGASAPRLPQVILDGERDEGAPELETAAVAAAPPAPAAAPYRTPRVHAPPPAPAPRVPRVERWRRAAAWAVDAAVVALVSAPAVAIAAPGTVSVGAALLSAAPHVLALAALVAFTYGFAAEAILGATAGHALLHLRVVGPGGARPGLDRCAVRAAVAVAGVVPLGAGLAWGLVARDGRALHDRAAETRVVRVP